MFESFVETKKNFQPWFCLNYAHKVLFLYSVDCMHTYSFPFVNAHGQAKKASDGVSWQPNEKGRVLPWCSILRPYQTATGLVHVGTDAGWDVPLVEHPVAVVPGVVDERGAGAGEKELCVVQLDAAAETDVPEKKSISEPVDLTYKF